MVRVKTPKESRRVKIHPPVGRVFNYAILHPFKKSAVWDRGVDFLVDFLHVFQGEWEVCGLLFDIFLPQ